MKMIRKLPKKSHNHDIAYPMVDVVQTSDGYMYDIVHDSNGNFIHELMYRKDTKRDKILD